MEFLLYILVALVLFVLLFGPKSLLKYYFYSEKMRKLYLNYIQRGFDNLSALKEISKIRHPELSDAVHEKLAFKFDDLGALINFIYWGIESHLLTKQELTDEYALTLIEAGRVMLQGGKYRVIIDKDKIASSQYEQRQTEAKKEGPTLADRLMGRVSEGKELSEDETEEVVQSEHELEEPLKSEAGEGLQEEADRISQGVSAMIYDYTPGFLYGTLKAFEIRDRGGEILEEVRDCMGMESGDLLVDENRAKDFLRLVKKYGSDMANKLYIEIKSYFIFLISVLSEKALDKDDFRNLLSYLDKIAKEDAQRLQTEYKKHAYLKYTLTKNDLEEFCRNICNILSKTSTVLTLDDVKKNVCNKDIELRMHLFLGFSLFFIHVLPVMTSGILEGELKYEMKRKKDKEALFFPKGVRASIVTGKAHLTASIDSYEYFPDDGYIHVDIRVTNDGEINIGNYRISYLVFDHSKERVGWTDGWDLKVGQSRIEYGIVYIGKGEKVHSVRVIDVEWEVD